MTQVSRVLLVDDHPIMTDGLSFLLQREDDLEVCGAAHSIKEAWNLVEAHQPHLVVSDLTLPDGNGLDFVKALRKRVPDLPVLIISMHDEILYAERALRAGARGYVMKGITSSVIVAAIREVLQGKLYFSQQVSKRLVSVSTLKTSPGASPLNRLTDRQLEIFHLIGTGTSTRDIAKKLNVSSGTIDAHRWEIRKRLGLPDNGQLVRYAVRWAESQAI